jgi:hypothetical protein
MVVVAGTSDGDFESEDHSDQLIVVYREPPTLSCISIRTNATEATGMTVHFNVTATDDSGIPPIITCDPPSGSLFPVGNTLVTCTATDDDTLSITCTFSVSVLVSRGAIEQTVADLLTLRAEVADTKVGRALDGAIGHLTQALAAELWIDQTHVSPQRGTKVFQQSHLAILKLCRLTKRFPDGVSREDVEALMNRILEANRLLAAVAYQDALSAAGPSRQLEQAHNLLLKGDQQTVDARCANGITSYQRTWRILRRTSSQAGR